MSTGSLTDLPPLYVSSAGSDDMGETTMRDTYTTIVGDREKNTTKTNRRRHSSDRINTNTQIDGNSITIRLAGLEPTGCSLTWDLKPRETMQLGREDFKSCRGSDVLNYISGTHFALQRSDDGKTVFIRDLDSTNGTQVDGVAVAPDNFHPLKPGSRLSLGGERLEFEIRYTI